MTVPNKYIDKDTQRFCFFTAYTGMFVFAPKYIWPKKTAEEKRKGSNPWREFMQGLKK